MQFEWDEQKSAANIVSRGLSFADAIPVFADPSRKMWQDTRRGYGEVRLNMLAENDGRVFFVTFTLRNEVVRIISFRKANQREVQVYGQD